ncbi:hypothetical protein AB1Y20_002833 [Prymnesium parvum]|uniref:Uncharacterized protein n=1 Tax=Prymnesium parvum TaxID=97485 RepID=A0AB34JCX3_PRYPA
MPLVRVKLMAGQRILAAPARPYASTKTVKEVLDQVLESHGGALTLRSALDVYPTAEENKSQRTELEKSDLGEITVDDVSSLGYFWVAHCTLPSDVTPQFYRSSALDKVMNVNKTYVLPPRSPSEKLRFKLFNALVDELEAAGLGWLRADAADSGKGLLDSLSFTLQYILPFDESGALERRSCYIPERFTAAYLKVQLKVLDHHGPRREKTVDDKLRLETQKLLDHSASLCSCLDAAAIARWGKLDEWQPFLEDVNSLMMSMDKLGNGKMAAAQRQRESSERKGPLRKWTTSLTTARTTRAASVLLQPASGIGVSFRTPVTRMLCGARMCECATVPRMLSTVCVRACSKTK